MNLAEQVVFVLVQPQHPGNVGATARAMKNMGLRRLVVVDPAPSFDLERCRWMAPGAHDVVDQMRIVATLDEALVGVHRAIASTARHRRHGQPVHEPAVIAEDTLDGDETVAILFGREDTGLSSADTLRCESILRIATDEHASLNLAQAVLLVAHTFFEAARKRGHRAEGRKLGGTGGPRSTRSLDKSNAAGPRADVTQLEPVVVELVALLNRVGFGKGTSPEKVGVTLREGLQRASLTVRHVSALRGMVKRVGYALDHPEIDWQASRRQKQAVEQLDD